MKCLPLIQTVLLLVVALAICACTTDASSSGSAPTQAPTVATTDTPAPTSIAAAIPTPTPQPTPIPAATSAPISATAREPLVKDWASLIVGLGGLAVAIITIYLSYKERTSSYRKRLYSRQLEVYAEVMNHLADLIDDEALRWDLRGRLHLLINLMIWAIVLPNEATKPLASLLGLAYQLEDGITDECYERFVEALIELNLAARRSLGTIPLSRETLNLFGKLPND